MREWHPQLGFLPDERDEPLPAPAEDPAPASESYVGWVFDEESGALLPPGTEPAPAEPAPAPAPETPKGTSGVGGAIRGVLVAGLRRLVRAIER